MLENRVFKLNNKDIQSGKIVYWMSREQRIIDNYALLYAQLIAIERKAPLKVIFCLSKNFLGTSIRKYAFMLSSMKELINEFEKLNIEFSILLGNPIEEIIKANEIEGFGALICDFDPLKIKQNWFKKTAENINCAMYEVDSHNIVPTRIASNKQEWAAYTIRPKINRLLAEYLIEYPKVIRHPFDFKSQSSGIDINEINDKFLIDNKFCSDFPSTVNFVPGRNGAIKALNSFIEEKLNGYGELRNDIKLNFQSDLSPYLHFGLIASNEVAREISKATANDNSKSAFLEELIIRKELADNFCFYNDNYDNINCAPNWAKETLNKHRTEQREIVYSLEQLESANTDDKIWNYAQTQALESGKIHGYLRMYWAKKLLEWTDSPETAFNYCVYLNDKYSIDGADPNGYAGIAWSIAGVHDRAWGERAIYGKLRYMSGKKLII